MTGYGRSRDDVIRWPDDSAARRALEDYLERLPRDPQVQLRVEHLLNGGELDFTGADLSGLDLGEAEFSGAILNGVRLVGADLFGAWLMGATLHGADLSQCNLRKAKGRTCDAQDAILRGANLDRSEFESADFRRADLSETQFASAFLASTDMRGADLRECVFGLNAGLTGLNEARLADCRVEGATGRVIGPVDVGTDSPRLLDGDELQHWFAEHGAPSVEIWQPPPQ
jgi:uncharacterized protein YjbI with pentapeptide repeats